jgi:hypothetical protein
LKRKVRPHHKQKMSLSRLARTSTVLPSVERYLVLVPPDGTDEGNEETEAAPAPPASTLPPHYQRLSACLPRSPLLLSSSSSSYSSLSFSSSAIPITVRPSPAQNDSESESESESDRESEAEEGEEEEAVDHQEDPPLAAADESASGGAAATTVVWRPDHEVELCTECGARFTLILRKVPPRPSTFPAAMSSPADDGDWTPCIRVHLVLCGVVQHHCRGCGGAHPWGHVNQARLCTCAYLSVPRDRDLLRPVFGTPEAAVGQF